MNDFFQVFIFESYLVSAAQEHFQREHAQTEAGANFGGARKYKIVAQASLQASRRYIKNNVPKRAVAQAS